MDLSPVSETLFPSERGQQLYQWVVRVVNDFPNWTDARLIRGLFAIFGVSCPHFLEERSILQLKRLLLTQFFLQKKIEQAIESGREPYLSSRVTLRGSYLCISIAYSKKNKLLDDEAVLEVISQRVPALKKFPRSSYQWICQDLSYAFYYIELEKMRGRDLSFSEVKKVESDFKKELCHYISEPIIFWPYNHEEAFKQLLILEKEISSDKDYPQVSLHFQKQTACYLEFLVYLARPKETVSLSPAITDNCFPASVQLAVHLRKEINGKHSSLIEAFSLQLPIERFKEKATINLLYAREFVAKLLQDVIGLFRDYNGGLFETQKDRFKQLVEKFGQNIPNFSCFGEELFYCLIPIEAQICLDDTLFEKLFVGFSQSLSKTAPFFSEPNAHVSILKSPNPDKFSSQLKQAKLLQEQGDITAYACLEVLSSHYLCLLDSSGKALKKYRADFFKTTSLVKPYQTLHLTFQEGELPSLQPYYLSQELRGRTLGKLLFEGLTRFSSCDQTECAGCEEVVSFKKKRCYRFKIRQQCWSNGKKVTAFQYEKSFKQNFIRGEEFNRFHFLEHAEAIREEKQPIDSLGVIALDEKTLELNLSREEPLLLQKLTHPIFFPTLGESAEPRSFNGPYRIKRRTIRSLILEKNPYYWDNKSLFFDCIEIQFEPSSVKIYKRFQEKKTHWIGAPFNWPLLDSSKKSSLTLKEKGPPLPLFIYLNTECFFLSSPLIRRALSSVLDRSLIAEKIFSQDEPLFTLLPKHITSCHHSLLNNNFKEGQKLFTRGIKELKIARENFSPICLNYYCHCQKHTKLARYLKTRWEDAFSIKVTLKALPWNGFFQQLERSTFQIAGFARSIPIDDSFSFFESFGHKATNYSRWSHPEYVKILRSSRHQKLAIEKETLRFQMEKILIDQAPIIPLITRRHFYAHWLGLKNYTINREGELDLRFMTTAGW